MSAIQRSHLIVTIAFGESSVWHRIVVTLDFQHSYSMPLTVSFFTYDTCSFFFLSLLDGGGGGSVWGTHDYCTDLRPASPFQTLLCLFMIFRDYSIYNFLLLGCFYMQIHYYYRFCFFDQYAHIFLCGCLTGTLIYCHEPRLCINVFSLYVLIYVTFLNCCIISFLRTVYSLGCWFLRIYLWIARSDHYIHGLLL